MEGSPITLAHNHARNAVLETRRSNPVAASEEHDLAAAEFANAAQSTSDGEALRTLNLLEQHHKQLGQILKFRHEHPKPAGEAESTESTMEAKSTEKPPDSAPVDASKQATSLEALQQPPRLARGSRPTARDLSSSIASNLASARGIPGGQRRGVPASPTISAAHVPGKFAKDQAKTIGEQARLRSSKLESGFFNSHDRPSDGKPSWAPPSHMAKEEPKSEPPAVESVASINDAPFQQFYNTLESLMSKLSAPLAFAGLPLVSTPNTTAQKQQQANSKEPSPSTVETEIDYSQLISKAALRAVQDGQLSSNHPAESFYFVPTTGGTLSYADIITRAERESSIQRHTRQLSNVSEDTMDDFVDANETLPSTSRTQPPSNPPLHKSSTQPSPRYPNTNTKPKPKPKNANNKTLEELTTQNSALLQMTDQLSRRLHIFEASAQSSSAALAYSIRSISARSNPGTPDTSHSGGKTAPRDDKAAAARIVELEDILRKSDRELQRRERENVKLKETVGRYREKWERLKEGARARRGVDVGGGGGGGVGGKGEEGGLGAKSME